MNVPPTRDMTSLGIYIQVPFCASKCTFCNFSSRVENGDIFGRYTRAVQSELDWLKESLSQHNISPGILGLPVDTLYIGGGTPAMLGEDRLTSIGRGLHEKLKIAGEAEFTLETTPGSADLTQLRALLGLGVNRLSIGAQTFDDRELRSVGRLHSADDTIQIVNLARAAGFQNISLDLIAGLPYQTGKSFQLSLESTVRLRPEHIALYLFEVDEKSRLGREVVHGGSRYHADSVPSDEFMADAYEAGCAFFASEGYAQYEISNFALPGRESLHNRKYWQLDPYVGLGAGAHSFDGTRRWSNHVIVENYLANVDAGRSPIEEVRALTSGEQIEEFFFLGLRQTNGISLEQARELWGARDLRPWEEKLAALELDGWLLREGEYVRLAQHALLVSNEIFQEFVSV